MKYVDSRMFLFNFKLSILLLIVVGFLININYNCCMKNIPVKNIILIDNEVKKDLLKSLGYEKDKEGFLVDHITHERILSENGKLTKYSEFAGILKGSTLVLKSDIDSVFSIAEKTTLNEDEDIR